MKFLSTLPAVVAETLSGFPCDDSMSLHHVTKKSPKSMKLALQLSSCIFLLSGPLMAEFTNADWHNVGAHFTVPWNAYYNAVTTDASGNVYVGGQFNSIGGVAATNVAKWNGTTWEPTGLGPPPSPGNIPIVTCLVSDGENVYVGGNYYHVSKWNGTSWSIVGQPNTVTVYARALCINGNELYALGFIDPAGEYSYKYRLAKSSGGNWTVLGEFSLAWNPSGVQAVCMAGHGGEVYIGGTFSHVNGVAANNVAKWNGTVWEALGGGVDGRVTSLVSHQGSLIVGGEFLNAGGTSAARLARWDGQSWTAVGGGISGGSSSLATNGVDLIVSSSFPMFGSYSYLKGVGLWNGTAWRNLGSGFSGDAASMCVFQNQLYCVGQFHTAGNKSVGGIARADLSKLYPTPYETAATSAGLVGANALPNAIPFHDGVVNLIKYAFNLNLAAADRRTMAPGGTAGLPHISRVSGESLVFRVEYLRRIDAGLNYLPQTSTSLEFTDWEPVPGTPQRITIDASWERVIHEVPATADRLFGRVGVELDP